MARTKEETVEWIIANCDAFDESDKPSLLGLATNKLQSVATMVANGACNNAASEDEEEELTEEEDTPEEEAVEEPPAKKGPACNTMEEWLRSAPQEVRETFNHAKEVTDREKRAIVHRIVANARGDKAALTAKYMKKPLSELQELASEFVVEPANYTGVGGVAHNAAADKDDFLPLPSSF